MAFNLQLDLSDAEWRALCAAAQANELPVEAFAAQVLRDHVRDETKALDDLS